MGFAAAVGATGCGSGPENGAVDLQACLTAAWGPAGGRSLGIFNCRRVGGSGTWSLHAEGRALDFGMPVVGAHELGERVLEQLLQAHDGALQRIIWWHRIFDLASPYGRPYVGDSPHEDHLHIELSWPAARRQIPLGLPDGDEEDVEPMPVLIVAFHGALWAVSPDLTSRVGLAQGSDATALTRLNGGRSYVSATLTDSLMARIPEVSAL